MLRCTKLSSEHDERTQEQHSETSVRSLMPGIKKNLQCTRGNGVGAIPALFDHWFTSQKNLKVAKNTTQRLKKLQDERKYQMSEAGGLMMFRVFYFKATNSLDALILHIVFNLLSLFSISCCPPRRSMSGLLVSPKNGSVSSSQAARRRSSLTSPEIVDVKWKEEKLCLKLWPSRNRCPMERQTRPALLSGCPSAGNRFGRSKVRIALRPLVLQSGRPNWHMWQFFEGLDGECHSCLIVECNLLLSNQQLELEYFVN